MSVSQQCLLSALNICSNRLAQYCTGYLTVRQCLNISPLCVHFYSVLCIDNSENVFINSSLCILLKR
jgi:hypothetical protein